MNNLTKEQFLALTPKEQVAFSKSDAKIIDAETKPTADEVVDIFDVDAEEAGVVDTSTEPKVTSDFDIVGDSVFLNINVTIGTESFRIKSIKLTEKRQCMDKWNKDTKQWESEHADVMSLIEMVRNYGSDTVNELATINARFGMAGEKHTAQRDPIAELLAAKMAEK